MSIQHVKPSDTYVPTYFLASVGAGGLAVTFFMYLLFWVKHPGQPVPVFEDIMAAFQSGNPALQAAILVAAAGIAIFAYLNIKGLIWNLNQLSKFSKTERYQNLRNSNGETTLLAAPLAVAMSINAAFIVGLVFVPHLWSAVEYMFPLAMLAFTLTGIWALRLIGDFLGRVLSKGGIFDVTAHNSFAQMLPAFALAMVAVGLSAPAAMSTSTATVTISLVLSTFFGVAAVLYSVVAVTTAFVSMLQHGTAKEASPTLLIIVPLMTVLGIMAIRQDHGLHVIFDSHVAAADTMMFIAKLLGVQLVFLGLGLTVLRRQGYFAEFVFGTKASAGSYALVCPGVALSVMLHFFINKGLVASGVITKFDVTYWALTAIALAAQFAMIALVFRLNRQHFGTQTVHAVPAE